MKKPLLDRIAQPDHELILRVIDGLSKFVVTPDDEIEANVTASREEVKIVFRIIKGRSSHEKDVAAT